MIHSIPPPKANNISILVLTHSQKSSNKFLYVFFKETKHLYYPKEIILLSKNYYQNEKIIKKYAKFGVDIYTLPYKKTKISAAYNAAANLATQHKSKWIFLTTDKILFTENTLTGIIDYPNGAL